MCCFGRNKNKKKTISSKLNLVLSNSTYSYFICTLIKKKNRVSLSLVRADDVTIHSFRQYESIANQKGAAPACTSTHRLGSAHVRGIVSLDHCSSMETSLSALRWFVQKFAFVCGYESLDNEVDTSRVLGSAPRRSLPASGADGRTGERSLTHERSIKDERETNTCNYAVERFSC